MPDTLNIPGPGLGQAADLEALARTEIERGAVAGYLHHLRGLVATGELDCDTANADIARVIAETQRDHGSLLDLVEIAAE